jgi:hypothetical protein
MKKPLEIPKGKDVVSLLVSGHSYVRLLDSNGHEIYRFQSPGEHANAVVGPGSYTIETDGKLGTIDLSSSDRRQSRVEFDALKPPRSRDRTPGGSECS